MFNKIHNNVQEMLFEARQIMQQHLSPLKKNGQNVRNPSPLSFNFKKRKQGIKQCKSGVSKKKYIDTDINSQISYRRRLLTEPEQKNKMIRPDTLRSSLNKSRRRQLTTLIPDQSQLLSTRIYGFHKNSLKKNCQTEALPSLQTRLSKAVKKSLNKQKQKYSRLNDSRIVEESVSPQIIKTIDAFQNLFIESSVKNRRRMRLLERAKSNEKVKKLRLLKKIQLEDMNLQPWQFRQHDDEFPSQ